MPGEIDIYKNATRVGRAQGIDFKTSAGVGFTVAKDIPNSQIDVTPSVRESKKLEALGVIAETFPVGSYVSTATTNSGFVFGGAVYLFAGETITGAIIVITTGGSGMTLSKVGLLDSSFARVAISADQGAAWETPDKYSIAFTASYPVTADGVYYPVMIQTASSTQATTIRGSANANASKRIGSNAWLSFQQSGQSDIPATVTPSATTNLFYIGLY